MGAITDSEVAALGSGYTAGDTLVVSQGGHTGATFYIRTVDGSGIPLDYIRPEEGFASFGSNAERGCGYSIQGNVPCTGGSGHGLELNILAVGPGSDATHGRISVLLINASGSGWAVNDTGLLIQGGNNSGAYRVTSVTGTGAVLSMEIDPGDGYVVGPATTQNGGPQPGSGIGFTFPYAGMDLFIQTIVACPGVGPTSGYVNRLHKPVQ